MHNVTAPAVPEDSQWQKKRSKLHNLLFGNHGNASPRDRTSEHLHGNASPQHLTPEPHLQNDPEGFAVVSQGNGLEVEIGRTVEADKSHYAMEKKWKLEERMLDAGIVVKMENIEVCPCSYYTLQEM